MQQAIQIQVLDGLEAVRRNAEMYAGKLDRKSMFNSLIQETLCMSVDEAISGCCTRISVTVSPDSSVRIRDNGSGFPIETYYDDIVIAEAVFTKLFACRERGADANAENRLCKMGIAVVNALSERFWVRNYRDGGSWFQEYRHGKRLAPFVREGDTSETGLEIYFKPDTTFFTNLVFSSAELLQWVKTSGANLTLVNPTQRKPGEPFTMEFVVEQPGGALVS